MKGRKQRDFSKTPKKGKIFQEIKISRFLKNSKNSKN
jgi:hypothetical protein